MLELKLYEAVPELNSRGVMGRVVVPPSIPKNLELRETGKFFLCCNRVFLTLDSFEKHRSLNCQITRDKENGENSIQEAIKNACSVNKKSADNRTYSCTLITDVKILIDRKITEKGVIKYTCRKCPFISSRLQEVTQHVKANHKEELEQIEQIVEDDITTTDNSESVRIDRKPLCFYKCDMCAHYKTSYKSNIVLHKQKAHVVNGNYPCCYCTCRYGTQVGLTLHLHRVHNDANRDRDNVNSIPPDDASSNKKSASEILSDSTAKKAFVAEWVQQAAERHKNRLKRKRKSEPEYEEPPKTVFSIFKCGFCPKLFEQKVQLVLHHRSEHLSSSPSKNTPKRMKITTNEKSISDSDDIVLTKDEHLQTETQLSGQENTNEVSFSSMQHTPSKFSKSSCNNSSPQIDNDDTTFDDLNCDMCGFIAKDSSAMAFHLKVAHVIVGVECECGCSFATATELTNHKKNCSKRNDTVSPLNTNSGSGNIKQETSVLGKYTCDCGSSFESRRKFSKHKGLGTCQLRILEQSAQNQETPDKNIGVLAQTSVNTHSFKMETENRPLVKKYEADWQGVQCPECRKFLKNDMGLRNHVFQMHRANSNMFTVCEICNYRTNNFRTYKQHKKSCHVVDGISCPSENCSCSCNTIEGLTQHYRMMHKQSLDRSKLEIRCDQCSFVTFKVTEMEKHSLKGHDVTTGPGPKKIHKCDHCPYTSLTPSHIKEHIERNHVENGFKCDLCNNSFNSSLGLKSHSKMVHKKAYPTEDYSTCKLCGYKTGNRKTYKEHYQRCHVGPMKCPYCVCTFKHLDGLSCHSKLMHKKKIDKSEYLLKCSHSNCMYVTYHQGNLRHHEKTVHCREVSFKDGKTKHVKCHICDMMTSNLEDHLSRAHVSGGFSCPENCKCSFSTELGLSRHMIAKHGTKLVIKKEKDRDPLLYPINCSECNFRSKDENSLNRHTIKMHGFSIPVLKIKTKTTCDLCHAQTTETLAGHKKRYHVPNGFKCLISDCTCSFETFASRARHMKKAHQITSSKKCHICKLKFCGTMQKHVEKCHVKNGLQCEFTGCICTFASDAGMRMHMRKIHNQSLLKEPKTCNLCGYIVVNTMNYHLARCHVPNGLPCSFCCCSFETELGRSMHMKFRHNISVSANCTTCGIKPVVSMNAHMKQSHVIGGLPCSHCECAFQTERIRIRHLARYHDVIIKASPKRCPLCKVIIQTNMKNHMRRHHVPNGYRCKFCNWSLLTKHGLSVHIFKMHGQNSNHNVSCKICGIKVTENIEKHMERNHSSTNSFKCAFCNNKFSTSLGRSRHIMIRHKNIQKKIKIKKIDNKEPNPTARMVYNSEMLQPISKTSTSINCTPTKLMDPLQLFPCPQCSCQFQSERGRNTHLILMHPNSKRNEQSNLKEEKLHSSHKESSRKVEAMSRLPSEEELTCPKCGYLATCKSHLNIHLQKAHVKDSPLACKFCSCCYSSKKELIRHQKIYHSREVNDNNI